MTLEPIDPATHDYAAEEARLDAWAARSHLRPPHTVSCLAYDGLCEHEPRMIEMFAMAEAAGIALTDVGQLTVSEEAWRLLVEPAAIDVAAFNVEARTYAGEVVLTGGFLELMRLNLVLADDSWPRGPRHRAAYDEFWPELSELLGEHAG